MKKKEANWPAMKEILQNNDWTHISFISGPILIFFGSLRAHGYSTIALMLTLILVGGNEKREKGEKGKKKGGREEKGGSKKGKGEGGENVNIF